MSNPIGWCDATLNPIVGCSKVSPACDHCYAERQARRMVAMDIYPPEVLTWPNAEGAWSGRTFWREGQLEKALRWRKPRIIFLGSMTDVFHETVPDEWQTRILDAVRDSPQHTWLLLTKRPARMKTVLERYYGRHGGHLSNLWPGVTTEDQERAEERVPGVLQIPAAVRFVSVEPMLGPVALHLPMKSAAVDEDGYPIVGDVVYPFYHGISWVICGPETGPGARPFDIEWARDLRDQCLEAGVPFWFKGGGLLDGVEWHQRPGGAR